MKRNRRAVDVLPHVQRRGDVHLENRIQYILSRVLAEAFLDPAALDHSARSLALAHKSGDLCEVARATVIISVQRLFFRQPIDSKTLVNAVRRLGQHRERVEEAMGYTAIGLDLQERGELAAVQDAYECARRLSMAIGLQRTAGLAWLRIGTCHDEAGRLEEARLAYEEGRTVLEDAGDRRFAALGRVYLAGVRARSGNAQGADALLDEAEALLGPSCTNGLQATGFEDLPRLQRGLVELTRAAARERLGGVHAATRLRERAERRRSDAMKARCRPDGQIEKPLFEVSPEARILVRIHASVLQSEQDPPPTLRLQRDLTAFQLGSANPTRLPRGRVLGRFLGVLVHARIESPGETVSNSELLERCWPGECVQPEAGLRRVRESVRRLRRLGLEPLLVTADGGYLLDPTVPVSLAEHT